MGKSKRGRSLGKGRAQAQQSQGDLISKIVMPKIQNDMNFMYQRIMQTVMSQMSNVQHRLMAVERVSNLDDEILKKTVADIEDEATGHIESAKPAEVGSLVRLSVRTKGKDEEEFKSEFQQILVDNLAKEPYTIGENLEKGIVGITKGETRTLEMDNGNTLAEVRADRVSVLKNPPKNLGSVKQVPVEEKTEEATEETAVAEKDNATT